jgi:hypothetical protein
LGRNARDKAAADESRHDKEDVTHVDAPWFASSSSP